MIIEVNDDCIPKNTIEHVVGQHYQAINNI